MGQPTWRPIRKLMVPQWEAGLWTPALDYIYAGKLYRILVDTLAAPRAAAVANPAPDAPPAANAAPNVQPEQVAAADPAPGAEPASAVAVHPAPNVQSKNAAAIPRAEVVANSGPAANVDADQSGVGGASRAVRGPRAALPVPVVANTTGQLTLRPIASALPPDQQWIPDAGQPCTADGDPSLDRKAGTLIIDTCAVGALIAKVGGSTADIKPDKDKVTLFGVGRHCVFSIADANKTGSLYLGINDTPESIRRLQGQLEVTIFEAL